MPGANTTCTRQACLDTCIPSLGSLRGPVAAWTSQCKWAVMAVTKVARGLSISQLARTTQLIPPSLDRPPFDATVVYEQLSNSHKAMLRYKASHMPSPLQCLSTSMCGALLFVMKHGGELRGRGERARRVEGNLDESGALRGLWPVIHDGPTSHCYQALNPAIAWHAPATHQYLKSFGSYMICALLQSFSAAWVTQLQLMHRSTVHVTGRAAMKSSLQQAILQRSRQFNDNAGAGSPANAC